MRLLTLLFFSLAIVASVLLYLGAFIVDQTDYAFRLQFGSPVGDVIKTPGLHFSIPFIQTVQRYDNRILDFDGDSTLLPTADKKYVYVVAVARWKIENPLMFYQTIGSYDKAQQIMDGIIDSAVGGIVSSHPLVETVRSTNDIVKAVSENDPIEIPIEVISSGREKIQTAILTAAAKDLSRYGIHLIAVRLKKIALQENVLSKVYERMISERKKIANKIRSEGVGKKIEITGKTQKEKQKIMGEAMNQSLIIKGKADAESARLYTEAFSKDTDFFNFVRQLASYRKTIKNKAILMLNSNDPYLQLLKGNLSKNSM